MSSRSRATKTTRVVKSSSSGGGGSEKSKTEMKSSGVEGYSVSSKRSRYELSSGEEKASGGYRSESSYSMSRSGSAAAALGAGGSSHKSSVTITRKGRSRSPLSITREEEKDELSFLNNRLAIYIEYVRQLETKNQELRTKFKSVQQVETVDVDSIKGMFEDEMDSLRRALDKMAKERAVLEVENRKMRAEWEEMKAKLSRKELEVRNLEKKIEQLERELADCRVNSERYISLKREYDAEMKQVGELKRAIERETVARNEWEAKANNIRKEMDFQNKVYREEKAKWSLRTVEIEEVEDRAKADYHSRLLEELELMREQTAEEMRVYKMEIENTFNTKFADLKTTSDRSMGDVARSRDEVFTIRKRYDELNAELAKKQSEIDSLARQLSEVERTLDRERSEFESQNQIYREENSVLRAEMEKRFREFNELLAIKIELDNEILAYRKLLESEELRCNLTHEERAMYVRTARAEVAARASAGGADLDEEELESLDLGSASSVGSAAHYSSKTSASGAMHILRCDVGESVTLKNSSSSDVVLGGWKLHYEADDKETTYKFPRNLTVRGGETCTIWSSETHTTHKPPHDLVMKGLTFFGGNKVIVTLVDKDDDDVASCELDRETVHRTTVRTTQYSSSARSGRAGSEERCSIM